MRYTHLLAATALAFSLALPAAAQPTKRNVIIFVADGLRYSSVTPETAPTMARLRREGVDFTNSHAAYPTLTTVNAAVIATGHFPGDTGNFGNTMYLGFPVACRLNQTPVISFVEDDCVLRQVKQHYPDGYIAQTTLLQAARAAGYNTVVIGKKGPSAIQYLAALDAKNEDVSEPLGIFIDESTNHHKNLDTTPTMSTKLGGDIANDAFGATGTGAPPFTTAPNLTQQAYLASVATQVILPDLKNADKPFVMLYWSRDPDTTQHSAHDSDGSITPGINSIDAHAAIYNADTNLKTILDTLKKWHLDGNTDVFVIADHGFSTIGHGIPTPDGALPRSTLADGFMALDVAKWLGNQKIFNPANSNLEVDVADGERPGGDALIGPSADAPVAMVAANGGSDFIYVPDGPDARATAKRIYDNLVQQPYVGGLFVRDDLMAGDKSAFAGALPMSDINMIGAGKLPRPAIIVAFRTFVAKGCTLGPQLCAVEVADTNLQTGQGMHGSFSRADTRNFMAAIGPDFKKTYADKAPVGNMDVAPTLAHILGVDLTGPGTLKGRVIDEALVGGKEPKVAKRTLASEKAANGVQTLLNVEQVGDTRYFDASGMPGRTVGLVEK